MNTYTKQVVITSVLGVLSNWRSRLILFNTHGVLFQKYTKLSHDQSY